MNTSEHGLRVAVMRALSEAVKDEWTQARGEAEHAFAAARRDHGVKSLTVTLPDGTEVGTIAIKIGPRTVHMDEAAALAWAEEHAPTEVTDQVDPAALTDPGVVALLREYRPDLVRRGVRPNYQKVLEKEVDDSGQIVDPATGECATIARVERDPPTGKFAFTPTKGGLGDIVEAWRHGRIGSAAGALSLPAPPAGEETGAGAHAAPAADDTPPWEADPPAESAGATDGPFTFVDDPPGAEGGPF